MGNLQILLDDDAYDDYRVAQKSKNYHIIEKSY